MPSMDLNELISVDYDFVPETSHLLQFEEPEECAGRALEFLDEHRVAWLTGAEGRGGEGTSHIATEHSDGKRT